MQTRRVVRTFLAWLTVPALAALALSIASRLGEEPGTPGSLQSLLAGDLPLLGAALVGLGAGLSIWLDTLLRRAEATAMRRRVYHGRHGSGRAAEASPLVPAKVAAPRDVSLGEALAYVTFRAWGRSLEQAAAIGDGAEQDRCRQFLQAACDGAVTVWGRRQGDGVFEAIPTAVWARLREAWAREGGQPRLAGIERSLLGGRYDHLLASRSDLEHCWPSYLAGNSLRLGAPRVTVAEDSHGRAARALCLLPVSNEGATAQTHCRLQARSLETEGDPGGGLLHLEAELFWRSRTGELAASRSLQAGERQEALLVERDLTRQRRSPAHQLRLSTGDLPLHPGRSYLLTLLVSAARGAPVETRIRLSIDRQQQLQAEFAEQAGAPPASLSPPAGVS